VEDVDAEIHAALLLEVEGRVHVLRILALELLDLVRPQQRVHEALHVLGRERVGVVQRHEIAVEAEARGDADLEVQVREARDAVALVFVLAEALEEVEDRDLHAGHGIQLHGREFVTPVVIAAPVVQPVVAGGLLGPFRLLHRLHLVDHRRTSTHKGRAGPLGNPRKGNPRERGLALFGWRARGLAAGWSPRARAPGSGPAGAQGAMLWMVALLTGAGTVCAASSVANCQ
jgi:hypothetical protein